MNTHLTHQRRISLAIGGLVTLLAGAAATLFVAPSSASDSSSSKRLYAISATPTTMDRGKATAVAITITNLPNSKSSFKVAKLTVPSTFTISSATASSGTVSVVGNLITVSGVRIAASGTLVVTPTVKAACDAPAVTPPWSSDVRASNSSEDEYRFKLSGSEVTIGLANPCFGAEVQCAVDGALCTTGEFPSPSGNTANVTVNDSSNEIAGTLLAEYTGATVQCDEYAASSDRLKFSMTVTNAVNTAQMTKTVKITQALQANKPLVTDYYACFQAPYDFPAQLPSQLAVDFNTGNFTGNTQPVAGPAGAEYKGLLLPCSAGYGAPCVDQRYLNLNGTVSLELKVPVGDPFVSF